MTDDGSDRVERRKAELWKETCMAQVDWPLTRAIAWIGFRDFDLVSSWMRGGEGPAHLFAGESELLNAMVAAGAAAQESTSAEPLPMVALLLRLATGEVKARGTFVPQTSSFNHQPIQPDSYVPASAWNSHELKAWFEMGLGGYEERRQELAPFLLPKDLKLSAYFTPLNYWHSVRIERESLLRTFAGEALAPSPPQVAPMDAVPSVQATRAALRGPKHGEVVAFCTTNNLQRARAAFDEPPSLAALARVIAELLEKEMGIGTTGSRVAACIRGAGRNGPIIDVTPFVWAAYANHRATGAKNYNP